MPRSQKISLAIFFLVAYASFLYLERKPATDRSANVTMTSAPESTSPQPGSLQSFAPGTTTRSDEVSLPRPPVPTIADSQSDEESRLSGDLSVQVIAATDAEARASAIQRAAADFTSNSASALRHAALHDTSSSNRYLAMDSLRQFAASHGDSDGSIRAILREIAGGSDREFAVRAQEAIQEIAEASGNP